MFASAPRAAQHDRTAQGIACGIGAGALWGLVFLAPELVRAFTPLQLAIGRYLAYGLIAAAMIAPRWRTLVASLDRRDWVALAWLALTGNTVYYMLLSIAVQQGGIAITSLVIGFLPVVVTLVGSREVGALPLRTLAPALLLCIGGAIAIGWQALAASDHAASAAPLVGLLCAIGALVVWSAYAIGNSRCLARLAQVSAHDWNLLTGVMTGAQALALIPLTLIAEPIRHAAADWTRFASVSIGLALLASIVGNALWNRMSRLLPLTLIGQMILFETLFALLYGLLWERRLPHPLEGVALVLVAASVMMSTAAHRRHAGVSGR